MIWFITSKAIYDLPASLPAFQSRCGSKAFSKVLVRVKRAVDLTKMEKMFKKCLFLPLRAL